MRVRKGFGEAASHTCIIQRKGEAKIMSNICSKLGTVIILFLVHTKAIPTTYAFLDYNGEGIMWSMRYLLWLTLCITVLQHYNVTAIYPRMPHLSCTTCHNDTSQNTNNL